MRAPLPPVTSETGNDGIIRTFRGGVILPATASDCRGTVTVREEVRVPIEAPWFFDMLGSKNSMVVPPKSGHEATKVIIATT